MTIEANLREFLSVASGLDVKQAPYQGARPDAPYLTYQIISVTEQQAGWRVDYADGVDTTHTAAEIAVSVNAYSPKGYGILSKANACGRAWEGRHTLSANGVALSYAQMGQINNLTGMGDTANRSRWQADLFFHADMRNDLTRALINEWQLSGEFTAGDGDVIQSSVSWLRDQ